MDWFIMVMVASQLSVVGPMTEQDCHLTKRIMFYDRTAICIRGDLFDGKRHKAEIH